MAHEPKPHGAFQEGDPASEEEVGVAAHLLRRLQAVKAAGNLPAHKMTRSLPDGGYVIAQDMGGLVKTFIVKDPLTDQLPPEIDFGFAQYDIPMLYSGHVVEPKPKDGEKVRIKLTHQTRRRLVGYDEDELGPETIAYKRFTLDYHEVHRRFKPDQPGIYFHSQYNDLFPSWWSGSIREAVQVALGFGLQREKKSEGGEIPKDEWDTFIVPEPWASRIKSEVGAQRLPGYTGKPPKDGMVAFRFDSEISHGLSFDSNGKPWLIEVSKRGVHAMPLPVIPATTTKAFLKWMTEDDGPNDTELIHLVERFGGVPSGEGFPDSEEAFEAWKKAGVIIKVCDASAFYAEGNNPMWWSCGWSFSESGKEGFATCYSWGDDGVKVGHGFKLKLALGESKKEKWRLPEFGDLDDETRAKLTAYLSKLYKSLGKTPESAAVKFKLYNTPASDILSRALSGGDDTDYWRNLECEPIATHVGSVSKTHSGKLYAPGLPRAHPKIKFPVPFGKLTHGCVDFDFSADRLLSNEEAQAVKCDTIMLGYYVGDSLKVVKYFRDVREIPPEHKPYESEDGCMTQGSWEATFTYTPTYMHGNFYTTDFDERELASDNESRSVLTAWPGGLSRPWASLIAYFEVWYNIQRVRAYHNMTETWSKENAWKTVAVCVPWGNRNAAIHVQTISVGRREHHLGQFESFDMLDTYTYTAGSYMKNWRWIGLNWGKNPVLGSGDGQPFLVDEEHENSLPCMVEGEQWLEVGDDVVWVEPRVLEWGWSGSVRYPTPPGEFPERVSEVKEEGEWDFPLHYSSQSFIGKAQGKWTLPYFAPSPDEYGMCMKVISAANSCGETKYEMLSEKPDPAAPNKHWGSSKLLAGGDIPRFIGVIHE